MSVIKKFKVSNDSTNGQVASPLIASLVAVDENGAPLLSIDGGSELIAAKSALSREDCSEIQALPVDVVVSFEQGCIDHPVITALVRKELFPLADGSSSKDQHYTADIDGKRIELSARDEIKLQCGKSSILLKKDGKIVIKGSNLISRSSASNKIKGGSVSIN